MMRYAGASARALAMAAAAISGGCNWVSLATNAIVYQTTKRGEAGNLVARDSLLYVTLAEEGVAVVDLRNGRRLAVIPPAQGARRADDLALADGLLFVLDAGSPGALSVYALADPVRPRLVSGARPVPVGPFSGVSAAAGVCIVSGGTSQLTVWHYDSAGALTGPVATADFGRGQPDVLLSGDGRLGLVATHYWGPYFGLDIAAVDAATGTVRLEAELEIDGAGFTEGGVKPANFPIEPAVLEDGRALVAFAHGVAVIDITTPADPRLLEVVDVDGPAVNVDAMGTTAAVTVAGPRPALVLLDFAANHGAGLRRIPLDPGTKPAGVALTSARAAIAARDRGVLVFTR